MPSTAKRRKTVERIEGQTLNITSFLEIIYSYIALGALTSDILQGFVEKITVHAPNKSSGHRTRQIDIHYNFQV